MAETNTRSPEPAAHAAPNRRVRVLLGIAIALLVALLIGLLVLFLRIMAPIGAPPAAATGGFQWIRSMYGYGPGPGQQLLSPTDVAIAPNGDIYVTDPVRSRIMVFSPSGIYKRIVQTSPIGEGPGQFERPEAVTIDEHGNLFVADSQGRKVVMFDSLGRFIREFPAIAQARGVFAKDDRLYVLDVGKVIVYDTTTGKFLRHFATRGHRPGQIDAYLGITSDGKTVYIADAYNRRIDAFDAATGKFMWSNPRGAAGPSIGITSQEVSATGGLQLPQDLVIDSRGQLVLVDAFNFDFAVADAKTGKVIAHYGGDPGQTDGLLYYPTGIAYDPTRDWFVVADTGNNRVQVFRLPGTGSNVTATARRWISSPYSYLCFPAVILLLTMVAAWFVVRRARVEEQGDSEDPENGVAGPSEDAQEGTGL